MDIKAKHTKDKPSIFGPLIARADTKLPYFGALDLIGNSHC
jgi:hypothetical protein